MNIRYNKKQDALYIDLAQGTYDVSKKITDSILVDITKKGKVLGIEILDASKNITKFSPSRIISQITSRPTTQSHRV